MKKVLPIVLMIVFISSAANAGWLDRYCTNHPNSRFCAYSHPSSPSPTPTPDPSPTPTPTPADVTLTEVQAVPYLSDETATYVFNSTAAGDIVYGGTCGDADKTQAVSGDNTVTWNLDEGTYSNCTIQVGDSNALVVPTFKSTSKYPVVFVHGWLGNKSAWNGAIAYLTSQGWDSSLLIARSITASNSTLCGTASPAQAAEVAEWIDDALEQFPGFDKVDLVGHSRGGSNIMRGLWHGYIDSNTVRCVVTLAGANRDCGSYFPAIPSDETPGKIKVSVYYSDGSPDYDSAVDYRNTHVVGAYDSNLWPHSHSEMRTSDDAMQAIRNSLLGNVGSN
jgi:pimeloyl-ACP methyl ester carboxylesterase